MKHIQAYTRTEDEAETLSTHLQALGANHVETGSLEEPLSEEFMLMVPLPANDGTTTMGTTLPVAGAAFVSGHSQEPAEALDGAADEDVLPVAALHAERSPASKDLMHVVACSIEDERYDEAVEMIRMKGGYVQ